MTRRRWGLLALSATLAFWSLGGEWVSIHQHVPENHFLDLLDQVAAELKQAISELRELARGIHPAILTEEGLVVVTDIRMPPTNTSDGLPERVL